MNSEQLAHSTAATAMDAVVTDRSAAPQGLLRHAWQDKQLVLAASFVLLELLLIPFAPLIAPHSPIDASLADRLLAPSWEHLLGTDGNGTDILSRLIYAPRIDLVVAIAATLIAAVIGTPLGMAAGYVKGSLGDTLIRVGDIILTFPVFVLALVVVTALGQGAIQVIFVVGFVQTPIYLRLMYGVSAALSQRGFVESARLSGASSMNIIMRHIFPNAFGPLFAQLSITIGISILLVDMDTPGIEIVRAMDSLDSAFAGGHAVVRFNNVRVPAGDILGEPGKGFRYAQVRLAPARLTHCMRWLGLSKRCIEIAQAYAAERYGFGQRLADRESIQLKLGDLAMRIEIGRLLVMKAAWELDRGGFARKEVSMAKVQVANVLHDAADVAIQINGARGYSKDTVLEWIYRYARSARLVDGASEVHQMVLARFMREEGRDFWKWG